MSASGHAIYALLWLSFGLGHSLLAGRLGRRLLTPVAGRWHRLAYNMIAGVHLALVLAVGRLVLAADVVPFDRPAALAIAQAAALALALVLFWAGGRRYDLGRFSGLRPEAGDAPPEPLVTDGLHAYLRHPLYAAGYLFLFGSVTDAFSLATALWGSLYLAIGTWFEERRLVRTYGEAYCAYRRRVPALLPRITRRAGP